MKALKIIGIILLAMIVVFLVVALFLPKSVQMKQSIFIKKPASLIYEQVNNYHNWKAWTPFLKMDPTMVNTYEGPDEGVGAKNSWMGKKSGNGSMTNTECVPYKKITAKLDFGQKAPATNYFEFEESKDGTTVTWGVDVGNMGYPFGGFIARMMPGMMDPVFKTGLENLKKVTEEMPDPPKIEMTKMPEMQVVAVVDSCNFSDIGKKMGQMFGELMEYCKKGKVKEAGYPMTAYLKWDEANKFSAFENRLPVSEQVPSKGRVVYKVIPATKAVKGVHFGAYDKTMYLYQALDQYVKDFGLTTVGGPIEEYVTDPMSEPDTSKWQTNVYFPVK